MKKKRQTDAFICLFLILCLSACGRTDAGFSGGMEYGLSETAGSEAKKHTEKQTETGQTPEAESKPAEEKEGEVCVYLCGEVVHPGVYTLPKGSRLCEGIAAAGGMTEEACREYWNLAELLADGQMIYVPSQKEAEELTPGAGGWQGAGGAAGVRPGGQETSSGNGKIDLNTATEAQLMTLPGIGAAKAAAIVAYRTEHGRFTEISELKNVTGIKDGVYDRIKEFITVN